MKFPKDDPAALLVCPDCKGRRTINQYIMNYDGHTVYLPCTCPRCAGTGAVSLRGYRYDQVRRKAVRS